MAKKKITKKTTKAKTASKKVSPTKSNFGLTFFWNIIVIATIAITFFIFHEKNIGYSWAKEKLLLNNYTNVKKYADKTLQEREEMKFGYAVKYLYDIKNKTPEDAVILFPSKKLIQSVDEKYKFETVRNHMKATYFLYPRKVIYEDDITNGKANLEEATHAAIIKGKGYERLQYPVAKREFFAVLPIKQ